MGADIIDGKAFAARIRARVAADRGRARRAGLVPGLAVVLVGDDPASEVYVRSKGTADPRGGHAFGGAPAGCGDGARGARCWR